ncbi:hypothetical protein CC78DRAFT_547784 [Lojkania enalia]|uniref:N-acetyltransferase domain-containing protein n=1 Tax=Lojkania enalia TaxID=147567 RepID=A0A9P4K2I0_9PLEO|nr:hypothetical protein CC78DRAFT_547784 [Didymosphaeria enalia]
MDQHSPMNGVPGYELVYYSKALKSSVGQSALGTHRRNSKVMGVAYAQGSRSLLGASKYPRSSAGNARVAHPTPDRETARKHIESRRERLSETGYGRYLVSLKPEANDSGPIRTFSELSEKPEKIGIISFKVRTTPGAPTVPDVGFSFLKNYWGKGYATEAAQVLLEHFEEERGIAEVVGYCSPNNESSKKVFQRLGFKERGVRAVLGLILDGSAAHPIVWSKRLKKPLEEYGV